METLFKLISSEIIFEGKSITVYGIETAGENKQKIYNITSDKKLIEALVDKCNNLQLSPIHIHDICEDFLIHNY